MTPVFADTFCWYGLSNPRDQWHPLVLEARARLLGRRLVTTEEVLVEFLGAMASSPFLRAAAHRLVEAIKADPIIKLLPQSNQTFSSGVHLYQSRPDKRYSLVDCISMNTCRSEGISEVLTNDHHFEEEGFGILIKH